LAGKTRSHPIAELGAAGSAGSWKPEISEKWALRRRLWKTGQDVSLLLATSSLVAGGGYTLDRGLSSIVVR